MAFAGFSYSNVLLIQEKCSPPHILHFFNEKSQSYTFYIKCNAIYHVHLLFPTKVSQKSLVCLFWRHLKSDFFYNQ